VSCSPSASPRWDQAAPGSFPTSRVRSASRQVYPHSWSYRPKTFTNRPAAWFNEAPKTQEVLSGHVPARLKREGGRVSVDVDLVAQDAPR
jgi:hypothetical protein